MSIQFDCPKCGQIIAFADQHAGKQAKCTNCGQRFVIPSKDAEKPKKIEEPRPPFVPEAGFYRAALWNNWAVFFRPQNFTMLVFVIAVVCFRFFLAKACCLNYVAHLVIWGWLVGFYLSIIQETALDSDDLPQVELGSSITWLWYAIRPILVFGYTAFIVELPFIIALSLAAGHGVDLDSMWSGTTWLHRSLQGLMLFGVFLFPAAILTTAVCGDITQLRPDLLVVPVIRAFLPYLIPVALLLGAAALEMQTQQSTLAGGGSPALDLGLNLLVQAVAIVGMRAIGLFYRYYHGYFRW